MTLTRQELISIMAANIYAGLLVRKCDKPEPQRMEQVIQTSIYIAKEIYDNCEKNIRGINQYNGSEYLHW